MNVERFMLRLLKDIKCYQLSAAGNDSEMKMEEISVSVMLRLSNLAMTVRIAAAAEM